MVQPGSRDRIDVGEGVFRFAVLGEDLGDDARERVDEVEKLGVAKRGGAGDEVLEGEEARVGAAEDGMAVAEKASSM